MSGPSEVEEDDEKKEGELKASSTLIGVKIFGLCTDSDMTSQLPLFLLLMEFNA